MSLLDRAPPWLADDGGPGSPRSADAATILGFFVVLQFLLPPRLALNGLPLSLSAASLIALGLGALWLSTQMTTTLGAAKGRTPVRTMLFVYFCVLLASYASSAFRYLPADERANGDHAMVTAFALIAVGLAVCDGVRSRSRLYFLLRVMVVCASGVAVVGILQYLFGFDLTPMLRPPGMHFTSSEAVVLERWGMRRVSGTTVHPIEFGVFCAMTLPLAVHLASTHRGKGRRSTFWWVCVGLIAVGLMFSVSRSAILAVGAVAAVLFAGSAGARRLRMIVASAGFLVFIQVVSPGLPRTFVNLFRNAGSDSSVSWRTHDYETAQALISDHLVLGRGLGTWYAPKHTVFDNQYLLTLVDIGVVGLVAILAILAAAIYSSLGVMLLCHRFPARLKTAPTDRDLALSLIASITAMLPTYATFDFAACATVSSLSFLLIGMSGALLRIVRADTAGWTNAA
ncbi:MAG: O-antigen ligase family protein [Nocardioides sp.]|uniref:O-antigen ligase family protein n=1 Tax=Nocardioides sp. TaxID=35761 RepID=UPI0032645635